MARDTQAAALQLRDSHDRAFRDDLAIAPATTLKRGPVKYGSSFPSAPRRGSMPSLWNFGLSDVFRNHG